MKNPKKIQCGIYAIENRSDGKRYYGSSRDILLRIKQHIYSLRRNVHHSQKLQHAWNKYKEENFSFILVKEIDVSTVDLNLLNDVLVQLEQFYINRDNTCSKNGYNMVLPDKRTGIKVKPDINEELMPNTKYYKSKDPRFVELRAFVPLECAEKFKNIRDSENLDNNTAMEEIVLEYCINHFVTTVLKGEASDRRIRSFCEFIYKDYDETILKKIIQFWIKANASAENYNEAKFIY